MTLKNIFLAFFFLSAAWAEEPHKTVYVITLHDEVQKNMVYLVRRGVKEAIEKKADALVLDIDTNGGRTDDMEDIVSAIERFPQQDQTYTYVNFKAFSAGGYISEATQHIYMAPGSVIGAMTPLMMGSSGEVQAMPEAVEKKIHSAFQALARTTAQHHGHDPRVFDAMVDAEEGLTIDGVEICPKGKILTLTNEEAEKSYGKPPKPLLSAGTVKDLPTLLKMIGGDNVQVISLVPTGFEKLARILSELAPILLGLGLLLAYLEYKLQSLGILAVLSGVCFLTFFFGQYIAGLSGYEPVVFFVTGVAFIILEAYVLPGLLFPTLIGLALVIGAILLSMMDHYPTDPILPSVKELHRPLMKLAFSLGLGTIFILIAARSLPKSWITRGFKEATVIGPGLSMSPEIKAGATGQSLTILRPSGTARIGEALVDVVTEGGFIEPGTSIKVEKVQGSRVVVTPL